jgi:hypothetical protein
LEIFIILAGSEGKTIPTRAKLLEAYISKYKGKRVNCRYVELYEECIWLPKSTKMLKKDLIHSTLEEAEADGDLGAEEEKEAKENNW